MCIRDRIKWIRDWNLYMAKEAGKHCLSDEQWREIEKSQFTDFIVMMQLGKFSALSKPSAEPVTKPAADKLAEFKKGNKRDAALYPILKDHQHWNNWNRSVLAQARAHDLKEVFDLENEPKEEDKELFEEKQNFAYAVLNRVVQTDEGKSFVREHEMDHDAREVYRKLLDFATKNLRLLN